jgi:hypothetical protein
MLTSSIDTGDLEADYDMFEDHDEACHGEIDSEWCQREFPENYLWSCCDARGDAEGCTKGIHVEKQNGKGKKY